MIKSKIFKSNFADIELEVMETGYIVLSNPYEKVSITLGKPENARIELIEKAIAYARLKEKK